MLERKRWSDARAGELLRKTNREGAGFPQALSAGRLTARVNSRPSRSFLPVCAGGLWSGRE
jgi:hypothetical protein